MNHSKLIGMFMMIILLLSTITYSEDPKPTETGALLKLIKESGTGVVPKPTKPGISKEVPGMTNYYVLPSENLILPVIQGQIKIKDVKISTEDLTKLGFKESKGITSSIFEDIKKSDTFRVGADGSVNYWAKSKQEWSRGLKKYTTTINTENTISSDGVLTRKVSEFVLDKTSDEYKKLSEAEKKTNLGYQVSGVELEIDQKTGEIKSQKNNYYYKGSYLGDVTTTKDKTIFNVKDGDGSIKSYYVTEEGGFTDLSIARTNEAFLNLQKRIIEAEVILQTATQNKESAEMDNLQKRVALSEAARNSEAANEAYNVAKEVLQKAQTNYENINKEIETAQTSYANAIKELEQAQLNYENAMKEFEAAQEATKTGKPGTKEAFNEAKAKLEQEETNLAKAEENKKVKTEEALLAEEEAKAKLEGAESMLKQAEEQEESTRFSAATAQENMAIAEEIVAEAQKLLEDAAAQQEEARDAIAAVNAELANLLAQAQATGEELSLGEILDKLKGLPDDVKAKLEDKLIAEYLALPVSWTKKISAMGVWRFLGVLTHSFNQYKGFAYLSALIFDSDYLEGAAKRKQEIQDKFCVIGGLKECWTSHICDGFISSQPGNYMLTKGPDNVLPMGAALIVGEKSEPITFKGMAREDLIQLFGETAYIDGVKTDFTKADLSKLGIITMWLYNAQMRVNNPLDTDLHVNVVFKGERNARWFANWRVVKPGEGVTRSFNKYSTTNYNQICLIFKEKIDEFVKDYGNLWMKTLVGGLAAATTGPIIPGAIYYGDSMKDIGAKSEYCVPFAGAGAASNMNGQGFAADDLRADDPARDGASV